MAYSDTDVARHRTPAEVMDDWADIADRKAREEPHAVGHYRTVSRYWREGARQARDAVLGGQ